jgi:SAM-dependent methyltransferase
MKCLYCDSPSLHLKYEKAHHPFIQDHGPFDQFECDKCRSLVTHPKPDPTVMNKFYQNYQDGMPAHLREGRANYSQENLYRNYLEIAKKEVRSSKFRWLEVGAGGGEFAKLMGEAFPEAQGTCIDFHPRPTHLTHQNVDWQIVDLNREFGSFAGEFDLIVSFAVFEHVIHPNDYLDNFVRLLAPGGVGLILCPDYSSLMRKAMDQKWPYYLPGEHLNMPSVKGMKKILEKYPLKSSEVRRVNMNYSCKYILHSLNLKLVNKLVPVDFNVPVPSGVLLAKLRN